MFWTPGQQHLTLIFIFSLWLSSSWCGKKPTTKHTIFTLTQHHAHRLTVEQSKARDACYSCYDKSVRAITAQGRGGAGKSSVGWKGHFQRVLSAFDMQYETTVINCISYSNEVIDGNKDFQWTCAWCRKVRRYQSEASSCLSHREALSPICLLRFDNWH